MGNQSKHGHLRKENYLHDRLGFINQSINETVYRAESALPHMHIHDFVEVSFVISGEGYHRTLNDFAECHPGDVYAINAGAPHAYFIKETGDNLVIQNLVFDPAEILDGELRSPDHLRYCCGLFREDPMISHAYLSPECLEKAKRMMDLIQTEQAEKCLEWEIFVKTYLQSILIMCSRRVTNSTDSEKNKPVPKLRNRQIAMTAMCAVLERYNDPSMTLERIAEETFVSKSHLSYVFKQVTGMCFSEYVTKVRLEEAHRLLRKTDMTNEQICHACGFRDLPSFYRFFQTHTGMTPFAYRKDKPHDP